jgi:hypothetical protein
LQGVGVAVLRGAVQYGQDPSVIKVRNKQINIIKIIYQIHYGSNPQVRRAKMTYGIGVIKPFDSAKHPIGTVL